MRTGSFYREERRTREQVEEFLSIFSLQDRRKELAKNLSYGEQRKLEIARALASRPKLLLLDEPAAGMNPSEVATLMEFILRIRDRFSLTVLLIEHQMRLVMGICERLIVMDFGQVIARGLPADDPEGPQGHRGVPGETGRHRREKIRRIAEIMLLRCRGFERLLRVGPGASGDLVQRVERGDRRPGRGERRREEHHAADALGHPAPASGNIVFDGKPIAGLPPHRIARLGIAHVPEGRGVFADMTVLENLEMGAYTRPSRKEIAGKFGPRLTRFSRGCGSARDSSRGTCPEGSSRCWRSGGGSARPDLLLLDEPSMGLSPLLVSEIFRMIVEINRAGTTILLVEQNAFMALSIARRAYVLETGAIPLEGKASDLLKRTRRCAPPTWGTLRDESFRR